MGQENSRLLIVYNADGGILNSLLHAVHKQFAPATYPCSLCALTYGPVSMRAEWRRFLGGLPMEAVFHHRDDFAAAFPGHNYDLPAVLIAGPDNRLRTLIGAGELDEMESLSDLIAGMEYRIELERAQTSFVRVSF